MYTAQLRIASGSVNPIFELVKKLVVCDDVTRELPGELGVEQT